MKKFPYLFALAIFAGLSSATASAQVFVGADDFSSGLLSTHWGYSQGSVGSNTTLSFTNNQLDFTGTGSGMWTVGWKNQSGGGNITPASYTTSWVANLTVTNT